MICAARSEERRGEVPDAKDPQGQHQPPEPGRQRNSEGDGLGPLSTWISCDDREKDHAEQAGDKRDPEDGAKVVAGGQEQKRRSGADQGAGRIKRFVKSESLAQVLLADRSSEHRRPDRLAQAASHPGQGPRDDDLWPRSDGHQQSKPEHRGAVAADSQALSPGDTVAVPAAPELDDRGRSVSHALDQADRQRGGAKAGGDEKRQDGEHHLVVRIRRQIRDTDSEDVAVQPPHRHRNGGRSGQMISSGSE